MASSACAGLVAAVLIAWAVGRVADPAGGVPSAYVLGLVGGAWAGWAALGAFARFDTVPTVDLGLLAQSGLPLLAVIPDMPSQQERREQLRQTRARRMIMAAAMVVSAGLIAWAL